MAGAGTKPSAPPTLSYAQRYEDLYLLRCFGDQPDGFYVDVGAGHPVADNVSFAFYLKGWRGITVEPNPYLAKLSAAVRPRDIGEQALVGAAPGHATFYLVHDFHGFSTTIESHAAAARSQFGKDADALVVPVTTLGQLCERHAPTQIDFLKIDVEGAERDVLLGADWKMFRPKVVVIEALAPYTMEPAWSAWESILTGQGYRYVWFDNLNRYYLADEASALAHHFESAPTTFDAAIQFGGLQPALAEPAHPDHGLATLLARAAMTRLPLLPRGLLTDLLTAEIRPDALKAPAGRSEVAAVWERMFGNAPSPRDIENLKLSVGATVGEVYARLAESDAFRTACGRISASYAW